MADEKKAFDSVMDEKRIFEPPIALSRGAHVRSLAEYEEIYRRSIEDPEGFWAEKANQLEWFKKWDRVLEADFPRGVIRWFPEGKLNASSNCLDRHLRNGHEGNPALIWEGEPDGQNRTYTYQQLHREVCKFANVLKKKGLKKGDRVALYMPMIPELPIAMLACARIGVIHSVVFGGFSAESLRDRILDCEAKLVVTTDGGFRRGKVIGLKQNVDLALRECPSVQSCVVYKRTNIDVTMERGRDSWWKEEMTAGDISSRCEPEEMDAEDPIFILYTSGSTGKPKGVLHTTGGYLLYALQTTKWIFDVKADHEMDIRRKG
jgi:acetyl-CoA synthetase